MLSFENNFQKKYLVLSVDEPSKSHLLKTL